MEMAAWPTCGQSGYITPAVLGVPNAQRGDNKTEMATRPTCGQNGYITPVLLGAPNAQRGDEYEKWLPGFQPLTRVP